MAARAGIKAASVLVLAACAAVSAASHAAEVKPAFVAGYDTGGDEVVNVTFTNGNKDSLKANEGFYAGGGVSVLNDAKDIEFLGTLSIKYASLHADNGDVTWTRLPLDALLFYRWESFRLGGGLTYVINPKLKGSGVASNINTTLDNAVGVLLQGDYLMGRVALGLRATLLDYKVGGNTVKSSGIGVSFGFTF